MRRRRRGRDRGRGRNRGHNLCHRRRRRRLVLQRLNPRKVPFFLGLGLCFLSFELSKPLRTCFPLLLDSLFSSTEGCLFWVNCQYNRGWWWHWRRRLGCRRSGWCWWRRLRYRSGSDNWSLSHNRSSWRRRLRCWRLRRWRCTFRGGSRGRLGRRGSRGRDCPGRSGHQRGRHRGNRALPLLQRPLILKPLLPSPLPLLRLLLRLLGPFLRLLLFLL